MTVEVTTVYPAAAIYTMDSSQSTASAVAVKGDRFWALGSLDEMRSITNCEIDNTFVDKILLPGLSKHIATGWLPGFGCTHIVVSLIVLTRMEKMVRL